MWPLTVFAVSPLGGSCNLVSKVISTLFQAFSSNKKSGTDR